MVQAFVHKVSHKYHLINTLPVLAPAAPGHVNVWAQIAIPRYGELMSSPTGLLRGQEAGRILGKQVLQLVGASMNISNDDHSALLQPV